MKRLALKVDCDTYEGTLKGIPNLLRLFDEFKIRASFFFTFGPDNSGRAAFRVFTQKGFLTKMIKSNAGALYGPRTMLYGTLLPAPMIGAKCAGVIRSVGDAGHEIGVHGWDHVKWHDKVGKMHPEEVEREVSLAHQMFEEIFQKKARASAAPGWHACTASLAAQEARKLLYTSDTRGGVPCFLETHSRKFQTLEIPTTLPTWDEMLADPMAKNKQAFTNYYRQFMKDTQVHSIHTEVEGTAHFDLFRQQLTAWQSDGVNFITLKDLATNLLADKSKIPTRRLNRISIPHRGGLVSSTLEGKS